MKDKNKLKINRIENNKKERGKKLISKVESEINGGYIHEDVQFERKGKKLV